MNATTKTILITGASSGIGLAIAKAFLQLGANVVLNSRSLERLQSAINGFGREDQIAFVPGDIGNKETGENMVKTALERFGSVDVLINNAGIFNSKPFNDYTEEDLDSFLHTNLKGTFFTSQAAVGQMKKQKDGVIVNIGTVLVDQAHANIPASAALVSKGGVHALTRSLAIELAPFNIRVNTIAPMIIETPLIDPNMIADLGRLHPLGHVGEVKDIVEAVFYLADSPFTSGVILPVDGGYSAGRP